MILYDIIWYYMILYDIIRYYIILYDIIWYYMILYDIIWYYMILYGWLYDIIWLIIWYYMVDFHDIRCILKANSPNNWLMEQLIRTYLKSSSEIQCRSVLIWQQKVDVVVDDHQDPTCTTFLAELYLEYIIDKQNYRMESGKYKIDEQIMLRGWLQNYQVG